MPRILLVSPVGIEPTTYWLRVSCSTSWAKGPLFIFSYVLVRPVGFEPTTNRFEVCDSIQLSYGRLFSNKNMGWVKGLEPSASGATTRHSNQLSYTHHFRLGAPGGIRTLGPRIRSPLLYPTELQAQILKPVPKKRVSLISPLQLFVKIKCWWKS